MNHKLWMRPYLSKAKPDLQFTHPYTFFLLAACLLTHFHPASSLFLSCAFFIFMSGVPLQAENAALKERLATLEGKKPTQQGDKPTRQ